jgi:hypothetical protein
VGPAKILEEKGKSIKVYNPAKKNRYLVTKMSLSYYEEKWYTKASAAADKWATMVKKTETYENYKKGVAGVAGRDVRAIKEEKGWAAYNYREFARKADEFKDKFAKGIEDAYKEKKWSTRWVEAFFG